MKKFIYLLALILSLSIFGVYGCGEKVTVTFKDDGVIVEEITISKGEKLETLPEIKSKTDGFIYEWNIEPNAKIDSDIFVDTIRYTEGVVFGLYKADTLYEVVTYEGDATSVYLPEYYRGKLVGRIGNSAFSGNVKLLSIHFPKSLTSIGHRSFYRCENLTSVDIPKTVTNIESYAFDNCRIAHFDLPEGITAITERMISNNKHQDMIVIPDGVKILETYSMAGQTITEMVLPKSLEEIEKCAIWTSDVKLKNIYYKGEESDWEKVIISDELHAETKPTSGSAKKFIDKATVYFYSENAPEYPGNYWRYVGDNIYVW